MDITTLDLRGAVFTPPEADRHIEAVISSFQYERACEHKDWFNPAEVEAEREEAYVALKAIDPTLPNRLDNYIIRNILCRR